MYCRKCGKALIDGTKFCGKCGCEVYIPDINIDYDNLSQEKKAVSLPSTDVSRVNSVVLGKVKNIPSIELTPVEEINRVSKNGIVLTIVFGVFSLAMIMIFVLATLNSNVI